MRKILLTALAAAPALFSQAQKAVTLTGELKNIDNPIEKVFISYRSGSENIKDTAAVIDGKYQFNLKLEEPTLALLTPGYKSGTSLSGGKTKAVFLDMANMKMVQTDSFVNVKMTGSKANDEFKKLVDARKTISGDRNKLMQQYAAFAKEQNREGMKSIEAKVDSIDDAVRKHTGAYIVKNPSSPIAVFALQQYAGYSIDAVEVEPLFKKLPKSAQATPSGKDLAKAIDVAKKTGVGQLAIDFTQNDTLGNPISLSSFRGKYVLLDFWASWCGPCRAENPNVVKAYNTYKSKGFDVLSVSLDKDSAKERWLKAIHDDNLTWTHVSDLQYWNNAVAKMYGIQSIPQNFLIDPQGKIIGKNLRGEELEKKLATIFN
jgi:peroxiredoxin